MSQNLNKIGTPVMWGSVGFVMETIMKSGGNEALKFHGRIVEVDKDSAADPDNKDMYAVIFCSSPHGTIVKVGISNVTEITEEEGFKELEKWEKLAKEDNKWYGGKLAFGKTTVGSNTIKVYSGVSVEDKCRSQLHPLTEVNKAKEIVDSKKDSILYSNSTDFITAIKYYADKMGIECEFFLDGINHGNNIEPLFEDFNRSLDRMDEIVKYG